MSTRSIIAIPTSDTPTSGWTGQYVHANGTPASMVPVLRAFVQRDGLTHTRQRIVTDSHGWSFLRPTQADFTGLRVPKNATWTTYENNSPKDQYVSFRGMYDDSKRFVNVPGMGIAYTITQGARPITHTDAHRTDAEFAYVLTATGIRVLDNIGEWRDRGMFSYTPSEDDAARFTAAECGENFEECNHYAQTHFPELVGQIGKMSTAYYLGQENDEPRFSQACEVILPGGTRAALSGSYGHYARKTGPKTWTTGRAPYLRATIHAGATERKDVCIGTTTRKGLTLAVPLVLSANLTRGEVILPIGTLID